MYVAQMSKQGLTPGIQQDHVFCTQCLHAHSLPTIQTLSSFEMTAHHMVLQCVALACYLSTIDLLEDPKLSVF